MDLDELKAVEGYRFPSRDVTIEPYEHWLTCDAVLAEPTRSGTANPMFVYYVALAGMGISVGELFALVGATADDGPMFGEAGIEVHQPLSVGATYRVSGSIIGIERKSGRRAGVFDIVTFALELHDEAGLHVGTSTNSFVFPRGNLT